MFSGLSHKTEQHIASLFPPDVRREVADVLLNQCGNNLPFLEKSDEHELERVRFAALKLSDGEIGRLREAVKLAQQDWRDLLIAADFRQLDSHQRWSPMARPASDPQPKKP
jgi:hypothetical protein